MIKFIVAAIVVALGVGLIVLLGNGNFLKNIAPPKVFLRAGETLIGTVPASWSNCSQTSSGDEPPAGSLDITDQRIVFTAWEPPCPSFSLEKDEILRFPMGGVLFFTIHTVDGRRFSINCGYKKALKQYLGTLGVPMR